MWGDNAYKEQRSGATGGDLIGGGAASLPVPSHSRAGGEFGAGRRDSAGLGAWRLDREAK